MKIISLRFELINEILNILGETSSCYGTFLRNFFEENQKFIYQGYFKLEKICQEFCFGIWGSEKRGAVVSCDVFFKIYSKSKGFEYILKSQLKKLKF